MSSMHHNRIHVPIKQPEDVIPHLGRPTHWKAGRSAQMAVEAWFHAKGLPSSIENLLATCPAFAEAELIDAFLERAVELGDGGRPSQTDVMAIVGCKGQLGILAVEAKVDETFGPLVSEWLELEKPGSDARSNRLKYLCALLGLDPKRVGSLRYQLLHRTASPLLEARRYRSKLAAMVVQSFCPKLSWLDDFQRFALELGFGHLEPDNLSVLHPHDGIELGIGWASSARMP
ncbi:hypothetical protein [Aquidulcibacter sp.]|jgi:hypothetical protein|uniref:DUF6946 family protein n=1 Tax=Aquidulcibacter sp. TaxID=2052990 RepID=UPI0025B8F4B5|nr:hypothetical protein [Aquidulcibacter sp.]MCA3697238.1 hypothetical protein [Aquidulcibacter sp.]